MTGTGEAMIARTMSRMEESRPPGVSMRNTTAAARRASAAARPRRKYSVVAGPTAPSSCRTTTGAGCPASCAARAWPGMASVAATASHRPAAARSSRAAGLAGVGWRSLHCGIAALLVGGPAGGPCSHGSACAGHCQGAYSSGRRRGLERIQIVAEAVVMIDQVGHDLIGVVAVDIVAAPALVEEYLGAVVAPLLAFAAGPVAGREGGDRLADQAHGVDEVLGRAAVLHGELRAVFEAHRLGGDVAFLEFGRHQAEGFHYGLVDEGVGLRLGGVADDAVQALAQRQPALRGDQRGGGQAAAEIDDDFVAQPLEYSVAHQQHHDRP